MNNIQFISETMRCTGCGACGTICPKSIIDYKWSAMGRLYASVNDGCIECGLCRKVCPTNDFFKLDEQFEDPFVGNIQNVYVGKSNEKQIFDNSQSGGLCTAVLKYLFETKQIDAAVVTRMYSSTTPEVKGVVVTKVEDLYACQKSCYTPVNVLTALKNVGNFNSVAVVGIPCHIRGLSALIKSSPKFKNVKFKLGLVCDRTLCSTIQDVMIRLSGIQSDKVSIEWRKKNFTHQGKAYKYENAPVVVSSEKELNVLPNAYRFALKDYFTAPQCRECSDKINVHADIVFGDPWRMPDLDLEYGASLVIVRTEIGLSIMEAFSKAGLASLEVRSKEEVVAGQLIDEKRKKNINVVREKNKIFAEREKMDKDAVIQDAVKFVQNQYSFTSRLKAKIKQVKERIAGK